MSERVRACVVLLRSSASALERRREGSLRRLWEAARRRACRGSSCHARVVVADFADFIERKKLWI